MKTRIYKAFALLLSLLISLNTSFLGVAVAETAALVSENGEESGTKWIVPVKTWKNFDKSSRKTANEYNMEVDSKALVSKNSDGSFHVRLTFSSYSVFDIIQVVNPEKNNDAIDYVENKISSKKAYSIQYLNYGNFDIKEKTDFHNPDNYDSYISKYIKDELTDLYFNNSEIKIGQLSAEMDSGFMEFDIDDLSQDIIINTCYSCLSERKLKQSAFIIDLEEDKRVEVSENLNLNSGYHGFEWTNYYSGPISNATGERGTDADTYNSLNDIFNKSVLVSLDDSGKMTATFDLRDTFKKKGLKIEIAASRDTDPQKQLAGAAQYDLTKEIRGTTFETMWSNESDSDQITLTFDSLVDNKIVRISTDSSDLDSENTEKYYFGHLWLTDAIKEDASDIMETADNGMILRGTTDSLPDFKNFEGETLSSDEREEILSHTAIESFAKPENIVAYQYNIYNSNDEKITPEGTFSIDMPIPEDYNYDTICYYYVLAGKETGSYGLPSGETEIIEESGKKYIHLTPENMSQAYYTVVIYDPGVAMTSEDLAELEEGYYKVYTTIGMLGSGIPDRPSMAAPCIENQTGVLEVVEKGKSYNLYIDLQGVKSAGFGYVYKWYMYDGEEQDIKTSTEILGYKTAMDLSDEEWEQDKPEKNSDNLLIDNFTKDYQLYYPQTLKLPLVGQKSNGAFQIGLVVPLMNSFGSADIKSGLKIADIRLIEGYTEVTDASAVPKYSKTLLLAAIQDVTWFMAEKETAGEIVSDELKTAYTAAQTVYASMADEPDETTLLEEVNKLKAALTAAGGGTTTEQLVTDGTYEVPYTVLEQSRDQEAELSGYFVKTAKLVVADGEMTVTLPVQAVDGDTLTELKYNDESSSQKTAETETDESGVITSFMFTRPYTESAFNITGKTAKDADQSYYMRLSLDLASASKITASDEELAELNTLLSTLSALQSSEYTKASLQTVSDAISDVQLVLEQSDYLEYDTWKAQMTKLENAQDALVSLTSLKEKTNRAKQVTDPSEELQAAIADAETILAKEDATKTEVATVTSKLDFLLNATGSIGSITDLADGYYVVPFEASGDTDGLFKLVEMKIAGDTVTMTVSMEQNTLEEIQFVAGTTPSRVEELGDGGTSYERWRVTFSKENAETLAAYLYLEGSTTAQAVTLRMDYEAAQATLDKEELYQKAAAAKTLLSDGKDYSEAALQTLNEAIANAEELVYDAEAEEDELQDAYDALVSAVAGMIDRTELSAAITEANAYTTEEMRSSYTALSYQTLCTAIAEARLVYLDSSASEEEIADSVLSLKAKVTALEFQSHADLGTLLAEIDALTESDYTAESWSALSEAVTAAEAVYENAELTDADYEKAYNSLSEAKNDLAKQDNSNSDSDSDTDADAAALAEARQKLIDLAEECADEIDWNLCYEDEYVAKTLESYKASVAASEALLNDSAATVEELNAAADALQAEFDALILQSELDGSAEDAEAYYMTPVDYDAVELADLTGESDEDETAEAATSTNASRLASGSDAEQTAALSADGTAIASLSEEDEETSEEPVYMRKLNAAAAEVVSDSSLEDGTYCVDYCLWQFNADDYSMGNGALADLFPDEDGKQAKIVIESSRATLYLEFQSMTSAGLTGHLLELYVYDGMTTDEDGTVTFSKKISPTIDSYTDETDAFGPPTGKKYPKAMHFDVTSYLVRKADIPVQVNVPAMEASAEQDAYVRCYWNTLQKVETTETDDSDDNADDDSNGDNTGDNSDDSTGDDSNVVELDADLLAALRAKMEEVSTADSTKYTTESYDALLASLTAAQVIESDTDRPDGVKNYMLETRTEALDATYKALVKLRTASTDDDNTTDDNNSSGDDSSSKSDSDSSTALMNAKNELWKLLFTADTYTEQGLYTDATYNSLVSARTSGWTVYNNSSATLAQIQTATNKLSSALNGLQTVTVNKSSLALLINGAADISSDGYTTASYLAMYTALQAARTVYANTAATQTDVDAAAAELQTAIDGLTAASGSSSTPGDDSDNSDDSNSSSSDDDDDDDDDEDDGYYKVNVRLWHASMNKASMGDPAVNRKAYVHIDGDTVTMRLVTKEMTVSGITAHLHDFQIYNDGDYQSANLLTDTDDKWIYEFELPNHSSEYYKCKVDPQVDVMGDEPVKARLKVSWKSLKEITSADWADVEDGDTDDSGSSSSSSSSSGSGSSGSTVYTSPETGVIVSGNAGGPGTVLEVSRVVSGTDFDRTVTALEPYATQFMLYQIRLKSGDEYVQPTEALTVKFPVTAGYDTSRLIVYRILDDGSAQEILGTMNGNYYEVSLDHFSLYALAESTRVTNASLADTGTTQTAQTADTAGTSGTGTSGTGSSGTAGGTGASSGASASGSAGRSSGTSGSGSTGGLRLTSTGTATPVSGNVSGAGLGSGSGTGLSAADGTVPYTGDRTPVAGLVGLALVGIFLVVSAGRPGKKK